MGVDEQRTGPRLADVAGWAILLAITAGAAWLRFTDLGLKPMHHDEAVNAWFVKGLIEDLHYRYNPFYYHGPFLYFVTAPFVAVMGYTADALRVAPALLGTLVVPAFVMFRGHLGWVGVLTAAFLMAVSPVEVYFSKTAIHEIYNGVFNVTMLGGAYLWWREGRRWGLTMALVSLALLFATKETTAITVAALAPALLLTAILARPRPRLPGGAPLPRQVLALGPADWRADVPSAPDAPFPGPHAPLSVQLAGQHLEDTLRRARAAAADALHAYQDARAQARLNDHPQPPDRSGPLRHLEAGGPEDSRIPTLSFSKAWLQALWRPDPHGFRVAIIAALVVWALLFSSFLTFPPGIFSFFAAFFGWGGTGVEGKGHEKIWHYFMTKLLWPYYKPMLALGLPGLLWGALRRDAFALLNLFWLLFATAAYSIIPYKTPWCVISFVTPLFIGTGLGARILVDAARTVAARLRQPVVAHGLVAGLVVAGAPSLTAYTRESIKIQSQEYDVDGHGFIYVQNVREFMDLTVDMRGFLTTAQSQGLNPKILCLRARNPLQWYMVDLPGDWTWMRSWDEDRKEEVNQSDIILVQRSQSKELKKVLDETLFMHRWYHERPGQRIDLWIKKPLWEAYLTVVSRGELPPPTAKPPSKTYSDLRTKEMRDAERQGRPPEPAKRRAPVKDDEMPTPKD